MKHMKQSIKSNKPSCRYQVVSAVIHFAIGTIGIMSTGKSSPKASSWYSLFVWVVRKTDKRTFSRALKVDQSVLLQVCFMFSNLSKAKTMHTVNTFLRVYTIAPKHISMHGFCTRLFTYELIWRHYRWIQPRETGRFRNTNPCEKDSSTSGIWRKQIC